MLKFEDILSGLGLKSAVLLIAYKKVKDDLLMKTLARVSRTVINDNEAGARAFVSPILSAAVDVALETNPKAAFAGEKSFLGRSHCIDISCRVDFIGGFCKEDYDSPLRVAGESPIINAHIIVEVKSSAKFTEGQNQVILALVAVRNQRKLSKKQILWGFVSDGQLYQFYCLQGDVLRISSILNSGTQLTSILGNLVGILCERALPPQPELESDDEEDITVTLQFDSVSLKAPVGEKGKSKV